MRTSTLLTKLILTGVLLGSMTAQAANIRIEQTWLSPNFATNGRLINTLALLDETLITGVGVEDAPLLVFTHTVLQNGVGQNFNRATFTDPPNLMEEGNSGARFVDGVFSNLFNVNNGGAARVGLINGGQPFNSAGGYAIFANNAAGTFELRWFFPISGDESFLLDQSATVVTFPQAVPVPGGLVFFLSGLGVLMIGRSSRSS